MEFFFKNSIHFLFWWLTYSLSEWNKKFTAWMNTLLMGCQRKFLTFYCPYSKIFSSICSCIAYSFCSCSSNFSKFSSHLLLLDSLFCFSFFFPDPPRLLLLFCSSSLFLLLLHFFAPPSLTVLIILFSSSSSSFSTPLSFLPLLLPFSCSSFSSSSHPSLFQLLFYFFNFFTSFCFQG